MKNKLLKISKNYVKALFRIDELMGAEPNTPEGDELGSLVTLVEPYEDEHYPIAKPKKIINKLLGKISLNKLLEIGITLSAVIATILNIRQLRICWLIWMIAGGLWFILLFRKKLWILFIAEFGWQFLNVWGWISWGE